jgi:serine protease Do
VLPKILARPAFAYAQSGDGKGASLSDIAERAVKSVVNVSSTRVVTRDPGRSPFHGDPFFERFFPHQNLPREERARSLGSGVIVSAQGVVLTNNHVVQNAQEIRVRLFDGRELGAKVVGSDAKSDLAVIQLKGDTSGLQPLPLGGSGKLRLGEVVLAIGNPFGVGQTVTMGIVSAIGRANMGIVDYEDFIQTDAAINPGNSGGALVNMRAELVGINTAILSRSGGYQGIGFAIPTDMARPIMDSLLQHGRVIRGWLGVVLQDLGEDVAQALKIPLVKGVLVSDVVPDGPAARAGLRRADVITHLDGKPMDSVAHLRNQVAVAGASAAVKLSVLRDGKSIDMMVKLSALPSEAEAKIDSSQGTLGGLTLEPLTDGARRKMGLPTRVSGVMVKSIEGGSAAEGAGLSAGDVILEINRQPVSDPLQFATLYREARGKVLLLVYREGSTMYLLLEK